MEKAIVLKIIVVLVFSVATFFFIKPKNKIKDIHLIFFGCAISLSAVLIGYQIYHKSVLDTLLLINNPGTTRLMVAQVFGYGLSLGAFVRMLFRQ